ncbi:MAG: glutaredoxin [Actinobacteria bacterium]|nr:glutaredoxin [Actinomycetota bacterium]
MRDGSVMEIVLLSQDHCKWCDDAKAILERITPAYPASFVVVDLDSAAGRELAARGGVLFPPGLFIDGDLFSYGRLSQRKLARELDQQLSNRDQR